MSERDARRAFWIAAAVAVVALMWLGRGLTFWSDEWSFIEHRSLGDPAGWFRPFNEHWSTFFILAYRGLVETVGLASYVPYLLAVALLHVACAWLVTRLVERRMGPSWGLAIGIVVLFFGAGFENLYWGFQIGFVGATAAGLAALDRLDMPRTPRRDALVAFWLLVSLMTAGVGLFFLVAIGVELVADRAWRRAMRVLAVPALVYVAWFATWGRTGVGTFREPLTWGTITAIPEFVVGGFGEAAAAVTGLGPLGLVVVAVVLAAAIRDLLRGRLPAGRFLGIGAAIVTAYVLIALARAGIVEEGFRYARYTYVTGILAFIGLAAFPGPAIAAWVAARRARPPGRDRLAALALPAAWLTLALVWNVRLLVEGRAVFVDRAAITRAVIAAAVDTDQPPGADRERWLIIVPAPVVLDRLIAERGSPLGDSILPWAVEPLRPDLLAKARVWLVDGMPVYEPDDVD